MRPKVLSLSKMKNISAGPMVGPCVLNVSRIKHAFLIEEQKSVVKAETQNQKAKFKNEAFLGNKVFFF